MSNEEVKCWEETLLEHFGPRCDDYEPECSVCIIYQLFDFYKSSVEQYDSLLVQLGKQL